MAVKIRLSRLGKKHRPYWRIVAIEESSKRDGAFLEDLGTYDSIKHEVIQLHYDRIKNWIEGGAQCSPTVVRILKTYANK
ncbi:MAG: 30S ribosomal protein S16 [candidate division TM6 bacterium GW2011_GWF2_38_10]|nr:MAG: 30S ribosomal protein S16 [candidate division TM6 bacterium GW2011_GWF2_38_10]